MVRVTKKLKQGELDLRPKRGGFRLNAGRPPNAGVAGVGHGQRQALAARHPVHVTLKLKSGLPRLRQKVEYAALRAAFAGAAGARSATSFHLCHFAVLNDHLHLIVEAQDRQALSRALQGLLVRIARALNRLWRRRGSVFADRYHDEILTTPKQVRNAIRYVLQNARHHEANGRMVRTVVLNGPTGTIDVHDLVNGSYTLMIEADGERGTAAFIKR